MSVSVINTQSRTVAVIQTVTPPLRLISTQSAPRVGVLTGTARLGGN